MARRSSFPTSRRARNASLWRRAFSILPKSYRLRGIALLLALVGSVVGLRESEILQPEAVPYSRSLYPHWLDLDGDCRDSRHEVLAAQSTRRVRWSEDGCKVESGRWSDPYTGDTFTDPRQLDIDHIVPLAEAHRSGADHWPTGQRAAFANDPDNLVAVDRSANRSKADGDPLSWLPPEVGQWCAYVDRFVAVKRKYRLDQDLLEGWWTGTLLWVCGRG